MLLVALYLMRSLMLKNLFLVENEDEVRITEDDIQKREISVHHIQYIALHKLVTMRLLALSYLHRRVLEIKTYSRNTFTKIPNASTKYIRSLPYTLFINAFRLYHNMYRPIPSFHAQFTIIKQHSQAHALSLL
jgi:hypothetical protein